MIVLHILPSLRVGGAEVLVSDYLINQYKSEYEFFLIVLEKNPHSFLSKNLNEKKIRVFYLDKKKGLRFNIIKKLTHMLKDIKPQIVHTHLNSLKYFLLAQFNIYENFIHFHTIHSEPLNDVNLLDYFFNLYAFHFKKTIPLAINKSMLKDVNKVYLIHHTKYMPNSVDLSSDRLSKSFKKIKASNSLTIGHVGTFKKEKNHKFIIKIFKRMYSYDHNIKLILVGSGKEKLNIIKKFKNNDFFHKITFIDHSKHLFDIYDTLDVFLFPSLKEGFGLSLLEAQLLGVYCVISDRIPKETIVSNKVNILSLKDKMSDWIDAIYNIPNYPLIISNNSFEISDNLLKLDEIYNEAISERI